MSDLPEAEVPVAEGTETQPIVVPGIEPTPEVAPSIPPTTPRLDEVLEAADSKSLRSNPKIAGIIGAENQRAIAAERERIKAEEGASAAKKAEEELLTLAQDDPVAFAEKWLTTKQRDSVQRQINELRADTRRDFATQIGRALRDIPEWSDLSQDDHEKLARAIFNKPEDDVLPVFNRTALELMAEKKALKMNQEFQTKELPKHREAIRQEEAAKLLAKSEAPDLTKGRPSPGKLNFDNMSDKEFAEWWDKRK